LERLFLKTQKLPGLKSVWFAFSALIFFITLCYVVKMTPGALKAFDDYFTGIIRNNVYPYVNLFFITITQSAHPVFVVIVAALVFIILIRYKKIIDAVWLLSGMAVVSGVLVQFLKRGIGRERPLLEHLVKEHSLSFPSGHSTAGMVLYGTILILVTIYVKNRYIKRSVQAVLTALIFVIGVSRIYVGVHFPTDVLGGFLLGGMWLCFSYPVCEKIKGNNPGGYHGDKRR
jgi:undecaprenyl-diphosphatase